MWPLRRLRGQQSWYHRRTGNIANQSAFSRRGSEVALTLSPRGPLRPCGQKQTQSGHENQAAGATSAPWHAPKDGKTCFCSYLMSPRQDSNQDVDRIPVIKSTATSIKYVCRQTRDKLDLTGQTAHFTDEQKCVCYETLAHNVLISLNRQEDKYMSYLFICSFQAVLGHLAKLLLPTAAYIEIKKKCS